MYKNFKQCARKVQYQNIDYLCTVCFKGRTERQESGPSICKSCGASETKGPALWRGVAYDEKITAFIKAGAASGPMPQLPEIANRVALDAVKNLAAVYPTGQVKLQEKIWLDAEWNLSPETGRTITLILDVLFLDEEAGYAQVLDWKTGSLTKNKKKLRPDALEGYIDQLEVYALGVLAKYPKVNHVDTAIYFLDDPSPAADRADALSYGRGENYQHVKDRWTRILKQVMSTEEFPPSQGYWCKYPCPYSSSVGGPCVF